MVCDKCRYVNKTGADKCRHCGASLLDTPEAEHIEEKGDIETTRIYAIKSSPRTVNLTKINVTGDAAAPVKPSLKNAPLNIEYTVPRESMETSDEGEEGDARGESRDKIKFIAIISALIIFVAGAVVVLSLLLNQAGKGAPAAAAAPAAGDITSIKPTGPNGQAAE